MGRVRGRGAGVKGARSHQGKDGVGSAEVPDWMRKEGFWDQGAGSFEVHAGGGFEAEVGGDSDVPG